MNHILYKILVIAYAALCFYLAVNGMPTELAGFVVAGALSLVFLNLEAFAEFSGAGFSAKLNKRMDSIEKEIEPIKSKATEPETIEKTVKSKTGRDSSDGLGSDALKVLHALIEGKYSWRTIIGLEKETKLSSETLSEVLIGLEADKLVTTNSSSTGKRMWGATMRGHITYAVEHTTYE